MYGAAMDMSANRRKRWLLAGPGLALLFFVGLFVAPGIHSLAYACCDVPHHEAGNEAPASTHDATSCDLCIFSVFNSLVLPVSATVFLPDAALPQQYGPESNRQTLLRFFPFGARAPPLGA